MRQALCNLGRFAKRFALLAVVIALGGCMATKPGALTSHRLKERLPAEAWEITRIQLEHLVGSHNVRGVPILDPSVDWCDPNNWPEHFQFRGEKFSARYGIDSNSDALIPLQPSRDLLPKDRHYRTQFFPDDMEYGATKFIQTVGGAWRSFGSLRRLMLIFRTREQLTWTFHPDGRLYEFSCISWHQRKDPTDRIQSLRKLFYDGTGKLRGQMNSLNLGASTAPPYQWDGKAVDFETFEKLSASIKLD